MTRLPDVPAHQQARSGPTFPDKQLDVLAVQDAGNVMPTRLGEAMAASAYTVAVLGCRKILAHVAVDQGAQENRSFIEYVDYRPPRATFRRRAAGGSTTSGRRVTPPPAKSR
ncbi:MAG TPA: hypothetical protein VM328_05645 [Fimbriimonadaceae bacterium]|jgi:hypothetical protein|nr:hypothetical protein [Fimbriimonadaceae bacterium]